MSSSFFDYLERGGRWIGLVERGIMASFMVVLLGFALVQIIVRNFFGTGYVWGDTLLRNLVLWISLLGAVRATAEGKHISIDILPRLLPPKGSRFVAAAADCFSSLVSTVLCRASVTFIENERLSGYPDFLGIPFWWLEVIFPLSFALMAVRFAVRVVEGLFGPEDGTPAP
jgi:TRAP-type C4-dicarboxylate transport system permease small subunit